MRRARNDTSLITRDGGSVVDMTRRQYADSAWRRLRRRQLATQRLKSNFRLKFRRIPLPFARHRVRPSQRANQAQTPV
jgi:hypothetical protein